LQKSRERKRRQQLFHAGLIVALVLALLAGVVTLLRLPRFQIQSVTIAGAVELPSQQLRSLVDDILAQHFAWLVPRSNMWFLPKGAITQALQQQFPPIAAVSLAVGADHVLRVEVTERQPVAAACALDQSIVPDCYLVDVAGVIFAPVAPGKIPDYFVWRVPLTTAPVLGTTLLPANDWANLATLPEEVSKALLGTVLNKYQAIEAHAEAAGDYRVSLQNFDSTSALLINAHNNVADALANVQAAVMSEIFLAAWEGRGGALEYLDARFPPKVFYKFK
jgi:hypothetical protein